MPIKKMIQGFGAFHTQNFQESDVYTHLVEHGQSPDTLVIACADSRNDPAVLTCGEPGDIFVVRNVAAIVPPYTGPEALDGTSAAVEFGVKGLKVKNIVVLGHALCGGAEALAKSTPAEPTGYPLLSSWLSVGTKTRDTIHTAFGDVSGENRQIALEQGLILNSLNNLMTYPWIKDAVVSKTLTLHGWYFDMVHGMLLGYDAYANDFVNIKTIENIPNANAQCGCSIEHFAKKRANDKAA